MQNDHFWFPPVAQKRRVFKFSIEHLRESLEKLTATVVHAFLLASELCRSFKCQYERC